MTVVSLNVRIVVGIIFLQSCFTYREVFKPGFVYEGTELYSFPVAEGDEFVLAWIHSVEDEEWEEYFAVQDGAIILKATRFRSFGAGVPYYSKNTSLDGNWVKMEGYAYALESLYVRVGEKTNHVIVLHGKTYMLPVGRVKIFVEGAR